MDPLINHCIKYKDERACAHTHIYILKTTKIQISYMQGSRNTAWSAQKPTPVTFMIKIVWELLVTYEVLREEKCHNELCYKKIMNFVLLKQKFKKILPAVMMTYMASEPSLSISIPMYTAMF
jgi:hypothetical protein